MLVVCFHFGKRFIRLFKEQQNVRPELLFGNIKNKVIMWMKLCNAMPSLFVINPQLIRVDVFNNLLVSIIWTVLYYQARLTVTLSAKMGCISLHKFSA